MKRNCCKIGDKPSALGIEGGGTKTVVIYDDYEKPQQAEFPPGNIRLLNDTQLKDLFFEIHTRFSDAKVVVAGMAGARTERDFNRIESLLRRFWKNAVCIATNDLETGLNSAADVDEKSARILVIAGTGACIYGRSPNGKTVKVNGWGHLLGDKGSGYYIGITALQTILAEYDTNGKFPILGSRILRKLMLNEPDDLIDWVQKASKGEVASIANEVFSAAKDGDGIAKKVLSQALDSLVQSAITCATRLKEDSITFLLSGGLFNQQIFVRGFSKRIKSNYPKAKIAVIKGSGAVGAVKIARERLKILGLISGEVKAKQQDFVQPEKGNEWWRAKIPISQKLSPTELPHPALPELDRMPLEKAVELFLNEDGKIPAAIMPEKSKLAQVVNMVARAFKSGGRLVYVGAGTSGRLGVLDASECPPTFGVSPEQVQAIIAGGTRAIWESIEGAEDDYEAGAKAVKFRNIGKKDVVIGIAASGKTPFVWGAIHSAKMASAKTVLICFNPYLKIQSESKPDIVISPETGPELLTGSTRLKAGTATKMMLNIITTLAMARSGRVKGNLMIDMKPSNAKLKDRAIRIVCQVTGIEPASAKEVLEKSGWEISKAIESITRLEREKWNADLHR